MDMLMADRAAVFLDRDGVLIEDRNLLVCAEEMRLLPGVPSALAALKEAGFILIVVSNQAVVARGLISAAGVERLHTELERRLIEAGGPALDGVYFCPHHPEATVEAYRVACDCRKPRPGLLLRAAREHRLKLPSSFMVGDRITDIAAGRRAGCRTVLIEGPKSRAADPHPRTA